MNFEEFEAFFNEELIKNNLSVKKEKYKNFYEYMIGIIEWNKKINLTSIIDEKMFIVKHFIDSLTAERFLKGKNKIIDIGTGAGFPGIPLKINNEDLEITLLDSVNKKLNVIREITANMNLKNIEIIHSRAEELAKNENYREKYDVAITRAVSNMSTIAEYMLPFVKVGGTVVCMKGPNYEEELEKSKKSIEVLGGKIYKIEKINIDLEMDRVFILIKKEKNTPKEYPRNGGKPLKEPIT